MRTYVLDTSLLLGGQEPPRDGAWWTTREAANEIKPGGKDARRYDNWLAIGLQVREADDESVTLIEDTARRAGNLARLSPADLSLLALAHDAKATLVTDDHTMLDIALRLGIATRTVNTQGIAAALDFRPRCTGCGKWYDAPPKADECIVCGSQVKARPTRPKNVNPA